MSIAAKLWVEKYRPMNLNEYVFRDKTQKAQVQAWVDEKTIPHLLFTGHPGVGKSALSKILINQLELDPYDIMEINASRESSVEVMRDKITGFIQTMPFGTFKVILLDECLDEDTEVVVQRNNTEQLIKIKDLDDKNDLVKSFNVDTNRVEWKTFELFDKGNQDTLEIEFENGEIVICTPDHKWYVEDENGNPIVIKASELAAYNHILT